MKILFTGDINFRGKENPEKYKSLRVRVSGFSDYFVNLSEPIQDDIIERTVHK